MNTKQISLLLFITLLSSYKIYGQNGEKLITHNFCSFTNDVETQCGKELEFIVTPLESPYYSSEVAKIFDLYGVKNSVKLFTTKKKGVEGFFIKEQADPIPKIIVYESLLSDTAAVLTVIFHEIGHYLNDNENLCSNPSIELDADQFAGVTMAKLNFNKMSCLKAYDDIGEGDGITHPFTSERKLRFSKGWNDGLKTLNINSFTSLNPNILWEKSGSQIKVQIDEKIYTFRFAKNKMIKVPVIEEANVDSLVYDDAIGLLYITTFNFSIQLIEPGNSDKKGIGRLVNDRTSITFIRDGDKFRYFNKGIEVKNYQTIGAALFGGKTKNDLYVNFQEQYSNYSRTVVFLNYNYSKDIGIYLQPAIYH